MICFCVTPMCAKPVIHMKEINGNPSSVSLSVKELCSYSKGFGLICFKKHSFTYYPVEISAWVNTAVEVNWIFTWLIAHTTLIFQIPNSAIKDIFNCFWSKKKKTYCNPSLNRHSQAITMMKEGRILKPNY